LRNKLKLICFLGGSFSSYIFPSYTFLEDFRAFNAPGDNNVRSSFTGPKIVDDDALPLLINF